MSASSNPYPQRFQTTNWSVVRQLDGIEGDRALATLCERYWYPLYAYARTRVRDVHKAQDLTQGFFAHVLAKDSLRRAAPERGRFRSFLLTSMKNFMANEHARETAQRRGGGHVSLSLDFDEANQRFCRGGVDQLTPERVFERSWTLTILDSVMEQLEAESQAAGNADRFELLKPTLSCGAGTASYDEIAKALDISSEAARQAASRLRKRYRELLREEVTRTLVDGGDVEDEIGQMFASLDAH